MIFRFTKFLSYVSYRLYASCMTFTHLTLHMGAVSGGRDISGHPVITFPASNVDKLAEIGSAGLVQLIRYYFSVSKVSDQQQGFAFVADLQLASQESHQVLVEALEFLQVSFS